MATKVSITKYKQCAILQLQSVAKQLKQKCVRVVPDAFYWHIKIKEKA